LIARLKLKPGQKGTKKLLAEHGDALVCVRYRYDEESCARIKTVELIVERTSWQPPAKKFGDNDLVPVQIGFAEKDLMATAKRRKADGTRKRSCGLSCTVKSGEQSLKSI
jgi:hypothetical protein